MTKLFDMVEATAIVDLSVGEYSQIRYAYKMEIGGAIAEYLYTEGVTIARFKNLFKKAIVNHFYKAFELGIKDGGGGDQAEGADLDWINAKVDAEFGFVAVLFQQLKELKSLIPDEGMGILEGVAEERAEGYARTLDGVYSEGKIRGAKNMMLTFDGDDGKENCRTCRRLKGQRHKASWWMKKGLTIFRGNQNYECGCWECRHYLFNDKGEIFTV